MNRYIWEIVSRYCSEEYRVSVFLATTISAWSVLTTAVGLLFCLVAAKATIPMCIANVIVLQFMLESFSDCSVEYSF